MIGFIGTSLQLQTITTAHNQSSVEPFFLDRQGLFSFYFSFYDWLQMTFVSFSSAGNRTPVVHTVARHYTDWAMALYYYVNQT
jgi:hypothetical protein